MLCPNCGSFQSNISIKCDICGHSLESAIEVISPSSKITQSKNNYHQILIGLFIVWIIIGIIKGSDERFAISGVGIGVAVVFYGIIIIGLLRRIKWIYYLTLFIGVLGLITIFLGLLGLIHNTSSFSGNILIAIITGAITYFSWKALRELKS